MSDTPETDTMVTGNSDPSPDEYEDLAAFTRKLERERDEARRIAKDACEILARENYQVNYPPMPWEPNPEITDSLEENR